MSSGEIFKNPTVKRVIFEIKFPNLFYIEDKIGEFQSKIIKEFPESKQVYQHQLVFAQGEKKKVQDTISESSEDPVKKIWQFKSEQGIKLSIQSDSLHIASTHHKTYNNTSGGEKFRDIIKLAVGRFLEIIPLPKMTRIGLRYFDECPMPHKTNRCIREYYNTTFPLERFDIKKAEEMHFTAVIKLEPHSLIYREDLVKINDEYKLNLDFDAFTENVETDEYLTITDALHDIIWEQYNKTIKEKLKEEMRKEEVEDESIS